MKKNYKLGIVLFLGLAVIIGITVFNNKECDTCVASSQTERKMTKFEEIIQNLNNKQAVLVDVRTIEEYETSHVKNAILWDVTDIEKNIKQPAEVTQNKKIYVYCRSGNRSAVAKRILESMGYKDVEDLGGISAVQRLGFELVQ